MYVQTFQAGYLATIVVDIIQIHKQSQNIVNHEECFKRRSRDTHTRWLKNEMSEPYRLFFKVTVTSLLLLSTCHLYPFCSTTLQLYLGKWLHIISSASVCSITMYLTYQNKGPHSDQTPFINK